MSTISNLLPVPPDNYSTTLNGTITSSGLSIVLNDVTGLGLEGVGVIYQKDTTNTPVAGTIEFIHWTNISGSTLTLSDTGDRGITGSANGAQAHSSGDTFEVWVHSKYYSGPRTALLADHNDAGTHKINILDAERYATDSGSNDTYVVTLAPAPSSYIAGLLVNFKPATSNTGAATININALGAKSIKVIRSAGKVDPSDGELFASQVYQLMYDGTDFVLVSTPSSSPKIRLEQQVDATLVNNTNTAIVFGASSEVVDTNVMHDTVTNNTRITFNTAGNYLVSGAIRYAGGNTTNRYETFIRLNGTTAIAVNSIPATGTSVFVEALTTYTFAVNDYIELMGFQATGGNITAQAVAPGTNFCANLLT